MIVKFQEEYLQELYENGKASGKKHRYQPQIVRKYKDCINILRNVERVEDLYLINSLNYEIRKGDKAGISSIRVNRQYRIEFTVRDEGVEPVVSICNILELSNHYK
jgi:proteic killer suppression protein